MSRPGEGSPNVHHRSTARVPSGAGKRRCLGSEFAMVEGVLILAMILQEFEIEPVPAFRVEPHASLTLRPKQGLKLKLFKRQK